MATTADIAYAIANSTGIPTSTADTVVRRLSEGGSIPRGTRGRPAPKASPLDITRALIGILTVADGFEGTAARVVQAEERIGDLAYRGILTDAEMRTGGTKYSVISPAPRSFRETLTRVIELCADLERAESIRAEISAVGLIFGSNLNLGWIEAAPGGNFDIVGGPKVTPDLGNPPRMIFGPKDEAEMPGLIREARVSIGALIVLAQRTIIYSDAEITSQRAELEMGCG